MSIDFVELASSECDPGRDVLVIIIDERRIKVISPRCVPISISDSGLGVGQATAQWIGRIELKLT